MSHTRRQRVIRWGSLALGVVLFIGALDYINFRSAVAVMRQLGMALPLAFFVSGLWHLARTWAWARCFPQPRQVSFLRLARVRLYAEAFSYLTLRGIAGEPLKVVLLADSIDPREVKPGDLLFFETVSRGASHVGVAIGGDQFVHAPSSQGVVRVERFSANYWAMRFVGARRVAATEGTKTN